MKCSKCDKEAVFDVPEPLCEEHWVDWWVGSESDLEKREEWRKMCIEDMRQLGYTESNNEKFEPLPARDLFALGPGDSFVVYWAKDGDHKNAVRFNYARQTIKENDGNCIYTEDGEEWCRNEITEMEENALDIGRGPAYFFKA